MRGPRTGTPFSTELLLEDCAESMLRREPALDDDEIVLALEAREPRSFVRVGTRWTALALEAIGWPALSLEARGSKGIVLAGTGWTALALEARESTAFALAGTG